MLKGFPDKNEAWVLEATWNEEKYYVGHEVGIGQEKKKEFNFPSGDRDLGPLVSLRCSMLLLLLCVVVVLFG